jgi:glyoxylase-like metal-dependent hydrolase (beta-lactamase superfamily II)
MAAMSKRATLLSALALAGLSPLFVIPGKAQGTKPPGSDFTGPAFTLNRVQDGIYHAVGTGALSVGCNASIIVNENDVLIVDSNSSPAAAFALTQELKAITAKPIRHVVNTHWHWDHAHGNQVYAPEAQVIGHEFTRLMLAAGESRRGRSWDMFVGSLPGQIEGLRQQMGTAPEGPARDKLKSQIAAQENYLKATNAIVVTPPTLTFADSLTLFSGGREIRLLFLGRGHTGGDVVVFLPRERVLVSGDLLTAGPAYLGDAYPQEWIATLDRLKALDFDTVLPGHGAAFQGKGKIDHFQSYLRDFWSQARKLHAAGVGPEEAARRIDLRSHAADFPTLTTVGVLDHGVYRAYDLLDGKVK